MATIGTFTTDRDGFLKGQIRTLNLDASVSMEPVNSDKEGAPAFRLYAGDVELGAAWAKTAKESGREYHQVRIDDPSLPAPIFANLVSDDDTVRACHLDERTADTARGVRVEIVGDHTAYVVRLEHACQPGHLGQPTWAASGWRAGRTAAP